MKKLRYKKISKNFLNTHMYILIQNMCCTKLNPGLAYEKKFTLVTYLATRECLDLISGNSTDRSGSTSGLNKYKAIRTGLY